MASDINQIMLTGRLTGDVEIKSFESSSLISGSLASNRSVKKDGQWSEEASFFSFKLWAKAPKQIEFYAKALRKGAQVAISGELAQERWEKDGEKKSRYVINVNNISIPFSKSGEGNSASVAASSNNGNAVPDYNGNDFPEDIPF